MFTKICRLTRVVMLLLVIQLVIGLPLFAADNEKCGGLVMDKQPPAFAKVGDWIDIHFTYYCEAGFCPTFAFDMGDGTRSGDSDMGGFLHQYPYPGIYTWSASVRGPDSCNAYVSRSIQICSNGCPGEETFNTRDTHGGPEENPDSIMEGGDGAGQCQRQGLPNYWVNTSTLNLVVEDTLISYAGTGPPVELKMTFNDNQGRTSLLGKGWRLSYESFIEESCDHVKLTRGSGKQVIYTGNLCPASPPTYPIEWTPPNGVHDRLFWYGDYWVLQDKSSRDAWRFDRVAGKQFALPSSITDSYGKAIFLAYQDRALATLTDGAGRVFSFTSDSMGRLTGLTAPDGRTAAFRYDSSGRLTNVTDLAGVAIAYRYFDTNLTRITIGDKVTNFTYAPDSNGFQRLSSIKNASGDTTTYTLDVPRSEVVVTDPDGGIKRYRRTVDGKTQSYTDPLGNISSRTYDGAGNLVKLTDGGGRETRFEYDARGNLKEATDPLGQRWSYTYSADDLLTRQTDPLGNSWDYTWNAKGRLTRLRSPLGREHQLAYDAAGLLVQITDPLGRKPSLVRDQYGNVAKVKDGAGFESLYTYGPAGLGLVSFRDAKGSQTGFTFDSNDRLTRVTHPDGSFESFGLDCCSGTSSADENGHETSILRDRMLLPTELIDPLGNRSVYEYDRRGNVTATTDPLGRITRAGYDAANRLTSLTDPAGGVTSFEYDAVGNLRALVDPRGSRTTFSYDAANRLSSWKDPLDREERYERDGLGRVTKTTNGRGQQIHLTYDPEGQVSSLKFGGTQVATYQYDGAGNLNRVEDGSGSTSFAYNARDQISSITYPDGYSVTYSYDPAGNRASVTYPGGFRVEYNYDNRNRPVRAAWPGGFVEWTLDPDGNLLREQRSNAIESLYTYDANDDLVTLLHRRSSVPFVDLAYTRDALGNTMEETRTLPLVSFEVPASDLAAFNAADQMTNWTGEPLTYDADGNLTGIGSHFSASFDPQNRPLSITRSSQTTTYTYDGLGNRASADRGLWKRRFHHGPEGELLFETDGKGAITVLYIYLGDSLIARRAGGSDLFYQFDSRGSTLTLTDSSGEIAAAYTYDPFGRVMNLSGSIYNPFTFVGAHGVIDDGDGLYYMRNRHYDSLIQRFLQRDPIGFEGGMNLYAYVGGNPIDRIDPFGLQHWVGMKTLIESAGLAPGSTGAAWLQGGFNAIRNWRGGQVVVKLISKTIIEAPGISRTSAFFQTWVLPGIRRSAATALAGSSAPTLGMCAAVTSAAIVGWMVTGMVLEDIGEKADLPRVKAVGKKMNQITISATEKVIKIVKDVPYFIRGVGVMVGLE